MTTRRAQSSRAPPPSPTGTHVGRQVVCDGQVPPAAELPTSTFDPNPSPLPDLHPGGIHPRRPSAAGSQAR